MIIIVYPVRFFLGLCCCCAIAFGLGVGVGIEAAGTRERASTVK